jgi:hypothetical protein
MLSIFSTLIWAVTFLGEPLFFLLQLFGLGYFIIRNDEEKVRKIFKTLEKSTMSSSIAFQHGKISPSGSFIGLNCIGYYTTGDRNNGLVGQIHIITTRAFFNKLVESEEVEFRPTTLEPTKTKQKSITFFSREGTYSGGLYYTRRKVDMTAIKPQGEQETIISNILSIFNTKGRATVFIQGVSGAGKSTIGLLVAAAIDGLFCHTFNPTTPGDSLHRLVRDSDSSEEDGKPIVVVIEEANILIHRIHKNEIASHNDVQILVYNKSTYNTFLDDMILFKNVVLIFTSNESKKEIDALDPCYLRKGRIDACYSMMKELKI